MAGQKDDLRLGDSETRQLIEPQYFCPNIFLPTYTLRLMMMMKQLIETVNALVADNKGLLAIDESISTCNKRFAALGIPQTEEQPALEIWQGNPMNVTAAQQALLHRAMCNRAACRGDYSAAMERP